MSDLQHDKVIDVKGKFCPLPILITKKELEKTPKGGIIKIVATDCSTINDFASWSRNANTLFELVKQEVEESEEGHIYINYIKKL